MRYIIVVSLFIGWFGFSTASAFLVPPLTGPVVDQSGLLSRQAVASLTEILQQLNNQQKAQLQVLVVDSLDGTPIEQASIQVVDTWKLGSQKGDNGVLLFIAFKDKKIRIEVGQGLEGDLPDVVASRIIREVIAPYFKQQKYSDGVIAGVFSIIKIIDPEFSAQNASSYKVKSTDSNGLILFVILFIIFSVLNSGVGRRVHRRSGPWGGGFGGGGFGGGGWGGGGGWSGGGGGFSGGGASGDW